MKRNFSSFQISGWFDDDFPGTRSNWALMQQRGKLPQRLLIGPWKHGYNRDRRLNGQAFGPDALRDDVWIIKQRCTRNGLLSYFMLTFTTFFHWACPVNS